MRRRFDLDTFLGSLIAATLVVAVVLLVIALVGEGLG